MRFEFRTVQPETGASAAALPPTQPAIPSIDIATEWLDDLINGSLATPNGPAFTAISAPYLPPALSASSGRYRLNLTQ
jgi:hypothetical protein